MKSREFFIDELKDPGDKMLRLDRRDEMPRSLSQRSQKTKAFIKTDWIAIASFQISWRSGELYLYREFFIEKLKAP